MKRPLKILKGALLAALILGLMACDDGSSSSGSSGGWYGVWEGQMTNSATGEDFSISMTLKDKGTISSVVFYLGFATVTNHPCFAGVNVHLSIHDEDPLIGPKVERTDLKLYKDGNELLSPITRNGNTLTGPYLVKDGQCSGNRGTLSLTKKY